MLSILKSSGACISSVEVLSGPGALLCFVFFRGCIIHRLVLLVHPCYIVRSKIPSCHCDRPSYVSTLVHHCHTLYVVRFLPVTVRELLSVFRPPL